MRLKREHLLEKLQLVSHGVAAREILDQSGCFIIRDNTITTFNDEILCEINYHLGITGAVHAKPLMDLLSKLPDEEIDVDSTPTKFRIQGTNKKSYITMHSDIVLATNEVEEPSEWVELHSDFSEGLDVVQDSVSKESEYFNLTCVHVTPDGVESCDGVQLTRYSIPTGLKSSCLLKPDSVKAIIGKKLTEVSEGKNWIHFRNDTLRVSCRRWIHDFADLDELIDFKGKPTTLPGGLSEAVDKAEIFSVDEGNNDKQVKVDIKKGKLRIVGRGPHGYYEEVKRIDYEDTPLSFMISPKLLGEITKRTNDCEITRERLKIDAGKFVFVACLGLVEEK